MPSWLSPVERLAVNQSVKGPNPFDGATAHEKNYYSFSFIFSSFNFDKSLIERIACQDEVDREILRLLFEAGASGLLPKDLAVKLDRFKVMRHQVSRRILRMNKRIEKEFGEQIVERRGWHWALTSFAIEIWGK